MAGFGIIGGCAMIVVMRKQKLMALQGKPMTG
jgi:hypothetical protein